MSDLAANPFPQSSGGASLLDSDILESWEGKCEAYQAGGLLPVWNTLHAQLAYSSLHMAMFPELPFQMSSLPK